MTDLLLRINELLTAAVLIVTFSLLAYVAFQNWRNDNARALCVLLTSVLIVSGGDILLTRAGRMETTQFLLRAQWLGIALVPSGYLHLSKALLTASLGMERRWKERWLVWAGYAGSMLFFFMALSTDLVVRGGISSGNVAQFAAGPLFWLYVIFFVTSILVALRTVFLARRNALTPTLRRRLTYLGISLVSPGLGVFPYLVAGSAATPLPESAILLLNAIVNTVMMGMITVMAYSVAFHGMFQPDRVIKQDFVRWGLYGPLVGVTIILCLQTVPWLEQVLGLPRDTLIIFAVMIMTVLMPTLIMLIRPYIYALVLMQDHEELDYLRRLPRDTFTRADLRQLLENTLIAVCGTLRVETGFVVGPSNGSYTVKALCGARRDVKRFVNEHPLAELMPHLERLSPRDLNMLPPTEAFLLSNGFFLMPLHSPTGEFLGALGVAYPPESMQHDGALTPDARRLIGVLAHQMEMALTTVQMQQRIFDTLRGLSPEVESLKQFTTRLEQATPASLAALETDVALQPEFPQIVKDALTHYWGGPKLSDSPLLGMRTVRRLLQEQGGSPTRALQGVLRQAIDNMRPDGQLDPSAQEWLLYNILELRFLQGKRIRDVANRLAMSESDFYRKQRIAVEEVARQLALMEDGERH
jgi:hypothetical protein